MPTEAGAARVVGLLPVILISALPPLGVAEGPGVVGNQGEVALGSSVEDCGAHVDVRLLPVRRVDGDGFGVSERWGTLVARGSAVAEYETSAKGVVSVG